MPNKLGRPPFVIDRQLCIRVENLAAQGLTEAQICTVLSIHRSTMAKKKRQYKQLSDAIKAGKDKGVAEITNALFKKAKSGDNASMFFWLCNRDPDNWQNNYNHNVKTNSDVTPWQSITTPDKK